MRKIRINSCLAILVLAAIIVALLVYGLASLAKDFKAFMDGKTRKIEAIDPVEPVPAASGSTAYVPESHVEGIRTFG